MPRYALDATRPLVAMVAATMLAFNPLTSESAVAFSQPLLLPFSVGQTWNICWYAYDEGTHAGNYALDIALAPGDCDSGESTSAGESAKSPGDGVIQHKWFNGVCIDLEGPGAFKIGHIDPNVEIGDPVTAGQTVGHVDPPEASNNFVSHLHIEAYDVNYCPK